MIHRTQSALWGASRSDLEETYRVYRGGAIAPGTSDAALRVACTMELLSATDATGHLGTPKGQTPAALTVEERGIKMNENFPEGTLAKTLSDAAPTAAPEKKERAPRTKINRVRALTTGTSKIQPSSTRAVIYAAVLAAGDAGIAVPDLESKLNLEVPARAFLQKLREKGHIEVVEE